MRVRLDPTRRRMKAFNTGIAGAILAGILTASPFAAAQLPSPVNPDSGANPAADLQALVRAVSDDAQRRSAVPAAAVTLVSTESVVWPDGSLGCPAPGRLYTQALVSGYRIRIEAGGQLFDYHANANGRWLLCPPERAVEPRPDTRR